MKGKDFLNSEWMQKARECLDKIKDPAMLEEFKVKVSRWSTRVSNTGLANKAKQLYEYFTSGKITATQKLVAIAALLYLISPIDLIPDSIPIIGWLDDIGVAGFALQYMMTAADQAEALEVLEIEGTTDIPVIEFTLNDNPDSYTFDGISSRTERLSQKLNNLKAVVDKLGIDAENSILDSIEDQISYDRVLNVMFVGRYSTGKSTIINALLGKELLPSSPIPTTKAITYLSNSKEAYLYSEQKNGEIIKHKSIGELTNLNNKDIGNAVRITFSYPEFPFSGVTFIDTPGLEDTDKKTSQLTIDAIPSADALIVLLEANYLQSRVEFDFISSLMKDDRERRLIIVINKIDACPNEANKLIEECKRILQERGISNSNIYALSAKEGLSSSDSPSFNAFKNELKNFLENGLKAEALRRAEVKTNSSINNLMQACNEALKIAKLQEDESRKIREKIASTRDAVEKVYNNGKNELILSFEECKNQFFNDFYTFIDSLKSKAVEEINGSSLDKLKNTNMLAERLKQEISKYVADRLVEFSNNIKSSIKSSEVRLRGDVGELSLPINVEISDLSTYSKVFMPTTIAASWFFLGFFDFVSVLVLAMVGQEFFEKTIASLLGSININRVRGKLGEEVDKQLEKCKIQLKDKLNISFDQMLSEIEKSYEKSLAESLLSISVVEAENSDPNRINAIRKCREELEKLRI